MAHGAPGVIAFLAAATGQTGALVDESHLLLKEAVRWVVSQQRVAPDGAAYSRWVAAGQQLPPARSAWCYGDPGVAAALRLAGYPAGADLALLAAGRAPHEAGVVDAGLCHGATGLGHVFGRLSQATSLRPVTDAAKWWLGRAIEMLEAGNADVAQSFPRNDQGRSDDPGFLTGSAGIGLALLAATTDIAPDWDRVLLLSMRPSTGGSGGAEVIAV